MNNNFWHDNRFMVTGGGGFLGTHLTEALLRRGPGAVFVPRHESYDLRHIDDIRAALDVVDPTIVIHAAAVVGGIGANREHPAMFFYDNLIMGAQLIEQAYAYEVKKFVTIGTVCAYPKHPALPFKESSLWDGYPEETNAPYGIAKKALLVQGQAYRAEYDFNVIYLLPTNLYGPGDNFSDDSSHVIPALIKRFYAAELQGLSLVTVWGDGSPTRDFLYVDDAARAILLATEQWDSPEPVNIGSGEEVSIKRLAEMIADAVGYQGQIVWDASKPNGQPRRALDNSRIAGLGFEPAVGFEEGLRKTIDWHIGTLGDVNLATSPRTADAVSIKPGQ